MLVSLPLSLFPSFARRKTCASQGRHDIDFPKVLPLNRQEWVICDLGERIAKHSPKFNLARGDALFEIVEGLARDVRLLDGERLHDDACAAEKHIAWAGALRPSLALNDYGQAPEIFRVECLSTFVPKRTKLASKTEESKEKGKKKTERLLAVPTR